MFKFFCAGEHECAHKLCSGHSSSSQTLGLSPLENVENTDIRCDLQQPIRDELDVTCVTVNRRRLPIRILELFTFRKQNIRCQHERQMAFLLCPRESELHQRKLKGQQKKQKKIEIQTKKVSLLALRHKIISIWQHGTAGLIHDFQKSDQSLFH